MKIEQIRQALKELKQFHTRVINGKAVSKWASNSFEIRGQRSDSSNLYSLEVTARTLALFDVDREDVQK